MEFTTPLVKGTLVKRYKRFLADVVLADGSIVTAHCPNTGAMTHCVEPNMTVWLRHDPNPKRKLAYTWEIAVNNQQQWIGINTHNANKLVEECLTHSDLLLAINPQSLRREVKAPSGKSRIDFAIVDDEHTPVHFIEVKSVTLNEQGQGYFPDAVTTRGAKHCEELASLAQQGYQTSLIFCAQHSGIQSVSVASHIDPTYAQALRTAEAAGVEIIACGCQFNNEKIVINHKLPFTW